MTISSNFTTDSSTVLAFQLNCAHIHTCVCVYVCVAFINYCMPCLKYYLRYIIGLIVFEAFIKHNSLKLVYGYNYIQTSIFLAFYSEICEEIVVEKANYISNYIATKSKVEELN